MHGLGGVSTLSCIYAETRGLPLYGLHVISSVVILQKCNQIGVEHYKKYGLEYGRDWYWDGVMDGVSYTRILNLIQWCLCLLILLCLALDCFFRFSEMPLGSGRYERSIGVEGEGLTGEVCLF